MKAAIIGGTGLTEFDAIQWVKEELIETPYGTPSAALKAGYLDGLEVLFLPRHGADHQVAPDKVNYRANIAALQKAGASHIISVNAVGGITDAMSPASIVIPDQIIDYSYGRESSFFDGIKAPLQHIDFTHPYSEKLRRLLSAVATETYQNVVDGGVYACTQGPRLETAAEIQRLRRDGCDLVGMTGMPEAALAREAGLEYASICLVVNWAAGLTNSPITMAQIDRIVDTGMEAVKQLILSTLIRLGQQSIPGEQEIGC